MLGDYPLPIAFLLPSFCVPHKATKLLTAKTLFVDYPWSVAVCESWIVFEARWAACGCVVGGYGQWVADEVRRGGGV